VIGAMKGAIGLSQDAMMRGRDWLTNTQRKQDDDKQTVNTVSPQSYRERKCAKNYNDAINVFLNQ